MNWIDIIIKEAEGFEMETGVYPKEIQISEDDWMDFKTQLAELNGDESILESEDSVLVKGIEIIPNELLESENIIVIK